MNKVKEIQRINERELANEWNESVSWHSEYRNSAWIYVGNLAYDLTEGDVICIFSQYGEILHVILVRDQRTGKSKGFAFILYEDQRSTILAVDNLNGIDLLSRTINVDHSYGPTKRKRKRDDPEEDEEEELVYNAAPPELA